MKRTVTIAICTYDRIDELETCLRSIKEFMGGNSNRTNVLVIDNKGQDGVVRLVDVYRSYYEIAYLHCTDVGLSHARNMAAQHATGDYIFYLDDDAKLMCTTLQEVFRVLDHYDFDIFGGSFVPYYFGEKPHWIPNRFGSSNYDQKNIGLTNHSLSGSLFIMNTKLTKVIKFDPKYGMIGKKIGYGEETLFQQKAVELGYSVGFNPDLIVEHLVAKYKHSVIWQLKSYFYHGLYSNFHKLSTKEKLTRVSKDIFFFIPAGVFFAFRNFITKRDFYYQNFIIDSLSNVSVFFGRIASIFSV